MRFEIIPFMGSLVFPLCWGQSQQEGSTQERFARVPLSFEENRGQADPEVRFLTRAGAKGVLFTDREAVFTAGRGLAPLRLRTIGSRKRPSLEGLEASGGVSNYFIGSPTNWRTN